MKIFIIFVVILNLTSALNVEQKKVNLINELNKKGELFSGSRERYGGYGQYGNPYGSPYGNYYGNYNPYYTTVGFPFNLFTTRPPYPYGYGYNMYEPRPFGKKK
ncbi:hypothetical protein PVAND_013046 [Polypedilum vanderplanki]|uniref:Uncharacterized protein n=1 Tax=Polypedilum vanderplanki TaxID=319348 RepID=A0A9J6CQA0_POLVA|nr:hypothetical protein PVAND_013046 [Polypedilum vanderplanki]